MMSTSCGTEIASMRAAVGEKIVGRQRNADGRMASQFYIYDKEQNGVWHKLNDTLTKTHEVIVIIPIY